MPERKKIKEYRETLRGLAKPRKAQQRKELEGKAAKLGIELYGEERKGKPSVKVKGTAKAR